MEDVFGLFPHIQMPSWLWMWAIAGLLLFVEFGRELVNRSMLFRSPDTLGRTNAAKAGSKWRSWSATIGIFGLLFLMFVPPILVAGYEEAREEVTEDADGYDECILMVDLDVSDSMLAVDVGQTETRLARAVGVVRRIINNNASCENIGITTFGLTAKIVIPPTSDDKKLLEALDEVKSVPGATVIGESIVESFNACDGLPHFSSFKVRCNQVIISDGAEDLQFAADDATTLDEAIQQAKNSDNRIYGILVGATGAEGPRFDVEAGEFPQDIGGGDFQFSAPEPNPDSLRSAASETNGKFTEAKTDAELFAALSSIEKTHIDGQEVDFTPAPDMLLQRYMNLGWVLLGGLFLLYLLFAWANE